MHMKNLKKYSRELYDAFMFDYVNTFLGGRRLSWMYKIPEGTTSSWIACVEKKVKKPCIVTGKIIESIVAGSELSEYFTIGETDIKEAMDKYFGKNEKNICGLKSKV